MANERLISDGQSVFSGGQDASRVPDQVPENCYFAGVNVTTEKGVLGPRNGFDKKALVLPDGGVPFNPRLPGLLVNTYDSIFKSGRYQMMAPYVIGADYYLVIVISGIIYLVNQSTLTSQVLSIEDGSYLNSAAPRLKWENAGKYLVIHDYPARPVIIQGVTARRADPANNEVPISVMGIYNQNRLFIVDAGNQFTAGDPTGNLATPDAPVTFNEVLEPASTFFGQIFELPTNYINDPITAMAFLQLADQSTGIGPLLIATPNSIYSFLTNQPRTSWETGMFGSVFVYNAGIAGARSFVNVNSDVFFMSSDGQIRSVSMSRDEQMKWSKVPLSREVKNWIKFWDKSLIKYSALAYFNNKIYITVNPYRVQALDIDKTPITDIAHGGMVVLEMDNLSNLSHDTPPSWAGLWTGINPMDIVVNNERCFVMSKDTSRINNLYEILPETNVDQADGKIRYVRSVVYTKEYSFKDSFRDKEIHSLDLALSDVQGDLDLNVKFKTSNSSWFLNWRSFIHKAPWRTCKMPVGCEVNGFLPQNFKDINLGAPVGNENECDPITRTLYRVFRKLQLKFTISSKYWRIDEFKIKANLREQTEQDVVCSNYPKIALTECCSAEDSDWYVPPFESCTMPET